jgi:hypothetical protein
VTRVYGCQPTLGLIRFGGHPRRRRRHLPTTSGPAVRLVFDEGKTVRTVTRGAHLSRRREEPPDTHDITGSMSRRRDCYDNALLETFSSSFMSELAARSDSAGQAKMGSTEFLWTQRDRLGYVNVPAPIGSDPVTWTCAILLDPRLKTRMTVIRHFEFISPSSESTRRTPPVRPR